MFNIKKTPVLFPIASWMYPLKSGYVLQLFKKIKGGNAGRNAPGISLLNNNNLTEMNIKMTVGTNRVYVENPYVTLYRPFQLVSK